MGRNKTQAKGKGGKGQNRKASEDFLQKNKSKTGVVSLDSGLQYLIQEEGEQPPHCPDLEATLQVHQRITLADGTIVADTYRKNETEEFTMAEAIDGLKEGVALMSKGSRYKFFIPAELAWGKRGAGKLIGPNAILIIDLRLLDWW